jgi:NADH-quinone oxidoreductase subunit J
MKLEFLAAAQITVYVGGIVVLIIFSIFLTQKSGSEMAKPVLRRVFFAVPAVVLGFVLSYTLIAQYDFQPESHEPLNAGVSNIGSQLMSTTEHGYSLPFELVSILLLAALIGCIVIAMKIPASGKEKKPENRIEKSEEIING